MTKIKLKKNVEVILRLITMTLVMFLISIDDFTWEGLLIIIGLIGVVIFNGFVLDKYGRLEWW